MEINEASKFNSIRHYILENGEFPFHFFGVEKSSVNIYTSEYQEKYRIHLEGEETYYEIIYYLEPPGINIGIDFCECLKDGAVVDTFLGGLDLAHVRVARHEFFDDFRLGDLGHVGNGSVEVAAQKAAVDVGLGFRIGGTHEGEGKVVIELIGNLTLLEGVQVLVDGVLVAVGLQMLVTALFVGALTSGQRECDRYGQSSKKEFLHFSKPRGF